jgi:hypothetical protein
MKSVLVFILLAATTSQAAVKSAYTVSIGQSAQTTLYWQHKSIKNKNVFVMGYHGPRGIASEQVIPKDEFQNQIKELKDWRKKLILKQTAAAGPNCSETVIIGADQGIVPVCLQGTSKESKTAFLRWYMKQTDYIAGRL